MDILDNTENMSEESLESTNDMNDPQSEKAPVPEEDSPAVQTDTYTSKLRYINFIPQKPDEDFWLEVDHTPVIKRRSGRAFQIILTVILILLILGYTIMVGRGKGWFTNIFKGKQNIEFTLPIAETPQQDEKYYNDDGTYTASGLAKSVLPSVVQINVYSQNALAATSQGSGIIMSEDGYIITNAHVVDSESYGITVKLSDGKEYSAKIVGSDASTDIAVLKISAKGLTPAQFADSDKCELGDDVIAIGSPAGYENTVTKGIISGLDRQIRAENSATAMTCIQIDAAINPGNSGGPLFNMWGQVIGITSSKLVSSSYDNIGFAITINSAKPVIEQLIEYGYIPDKPRMGITYYSISEETAKLYDVEPGMCVVTIDENCNVADTELSEGDIIMTLNGQAAYDTNKVSKIMGDLKAGDKMTCKIFRPSKEENAKKSDGEYFDITFSLNADQPFIQNDSDNS